MQHQRISKFQLLKLAFFSCQYKLMQAQAMCMHNIGWHYSKENQFKAMVGKIRTSLYNSIRSTLQQKKNNLKGVFLTSVMSLLGYTFICYYTSVMSFSGCLYLLEKKNDLKRMQLMQGESQEGFLYRNMYNSNLMFIININ